MRLSPNLPYNLVILPLILIGQTGVRGSHSQQQTAARHAGRWESHTLTQPSQSNTITQLWKPRLREVKGQT